MFEPLNFSLFSAGGEKSTQPGELLQEHESFDEHHEGGKSVHSGLEAGKGSEIVDSERDQMDRDTTHVTTTVVDEQVVTTRQTVLTEQSQRTTTTTSHTSNGQLQYAVSATQGGVQEASIHYETRFPAITDSSFMPIPGPMALESRALQKPTFSSAQHMLLALQRTHEEENKRLISALLSEHDDHERRCGEQLVAFQKEKEGLLQELVAATSRISQLEIELKSLRGSNTTIGESVISDSVVIAATTSITIITTTITTIITHVEKWKNGGSGGHISILNADLQQLALDLSAISSRLIELRGSCDELLKSFGAVRRDLQVALSLRDEQDRRIASLTAEITQWKNAYAEKVQQLAALGQDNESLRLDNTLTSSQISVFQERQDAQLRELISLHDKLQTQALSIDEKDRIITSLEAEVVQWKQSDTKKADDHELKTETLQYEHTISYLNAQVEQWKRTYNAEADRLTVAHEHVDKVKEDLSLVTSQLAELKSQYEAQSRVLAELRSTLQISETSNEDKDRTIASLTAEVNRKKKLDGRVSGARCCCCCVIC